MYPHFRGDYIEEVTFREVTFPKSCSQSSETLGFKFRFLRSSPLAVNYGWAGSRSVCCPAKDADVGTKNYNIWLPSGS